MKNPSDWRQYARLLLSQARARYGSDFALILLQGAKRARVSAHQGQPAQGRFAL
jgi:hypothetical protein